MTGTLGVYDLVVKAQEATEAARAAYSKLEAKVAKENTSRFNAFVRTLHTRELGVCGVCYRPRPIEQLTLVWGYKPYRSPRIVLPACSSCLSNRYRNREAHPLWAVGEGYCYRSAGKLHEQPADAQSLPYEIWVPSKTVTQEFARRFGLEVSLRLDHRARLPHYAPMLVPVR